MSNKKNLPNIPIYIGDWERDCNVLTLESEAAWMRIVFKLWTKGKQNSIKIPTKSLQNLWRCDEQKMNEILDDLIFNEIAEINVGERFVEFTCRRFVKENELSEIRSKASKGMKKSNKMKSKLKQTLNKNEQNTDYDNDNEIEDVNKNKNEYFEKSEKLLNTEVDSDEFLNIKNLKEKFQTETTWKESIFRNIREIQPNFKFDDVDNYLETFFKTIQGDGEEFKTIKDTKKHFNRWLIIQIKNGNKSNNNQRSDSDIKRGVSAAVDSMFGE